MSKATLPSSGAKNEYAAESRVESSTDFSCVRDARQIEHDAVPCRGRSQRAARGAQLRLFFSDVSSIGTRSDVFLAQRFAGEGCGVLGRVRLV